MLQYVDSKNSTRKHKASGSFWIVTRACGEIIGGRGPAQVMTTDRANSWKWQQQHVPLSSSKAEIEQYGSPAEEAQTGSECYSTFN